MARHDGQQHKGTRQRARKRGAKNAGFGVEESGVRDLAEVARWSLEWSLDSSDVPRPMGSACVRAPRAKKRDLALRCDNPEALRPPTTRPPLTIHTAGRPAGAMSSRVHVLCVRALQAACYAQRLTEMQTLVQAGPEAVA